MTSRKKVHGLAPHSWWAQSDLCLLYPRPQYFAIYYGGSGHSLGLGAVYAVCNPGRRHSGLIAPASIWEFSIFFIVIPEMMIASVGFKKDLVKNVFHNQPVYVVVMGGVSLLIAALMVLRVEDHGDSQGDLPIVGH